MKGVKPVVLIGTVFLSKLAFSQPNEENSPISLSVSREGHSAAIVLRATGEDVFVPACRGIVWEQFIQPESDAEDSYIPITEPPCGPSNPPIKVSKEGVRFDAPESVVGSSGVLRAVIVVGLGCAADRPVAVGECTSLHSETSANITITAAGQE